ncbi:uncharacterized protein LOC111411317 [Olea europaea var. sylvestris]|uniref:uncharacterized protein LOC111411317 n=1 Tax=Olea europaea var. sylvestris TaxID=158386 RepID=UPI000C1D7222|nr:uncharacterized protein LOC111411317 [Olea europaea var. sylvestris]XP_022897633.1 uncharacterized protein LOC111411317 [Olea europaea var. sylvestris]
MAKPQILCLLCLSLVSLSFSSSISTSNPKVQSKSGTGEAHQELIKYGFPIGLLPTDVQSLSLNHTSGRFLVMLGDTCRVTLPPDNYLATYSKKITGKIVDSRIAEIDGIRVRAFFKWWGITGIRSNGQDLVFEVGVLSAKYPSKNFDEAPDCEGRRASS